MHGTVVPEGSTMLLLNGAANRDERHFTAPDRLDVHRDEGPHLAFGYGLHFCLGAALARLEGRVVLEEVLARWPSWDRRHRPWADGPYGKCARMGSPPRPARARERPWVKERQAMSKRVVVWSTGGIGKLSIVAVNERPDLELVGVWVHSEDKVGQDAGVLANGVAIGVEATNDVDALIALEPDCVIYGASGPGPRRGRRARLRAPARRRDQRRDHHLDHAHQPPRLRAVAP